MEEPELKGGKDRSDGDGEDGATADCKSKLREFDQICFTLKCLYFETFESFRDFKILL